MWTGKNLLIAAREKIVHNWISRYMAATAEGIPCPSDEADCWCSIGALHNLCPVSKDQEWRYNSLMPAAKEATYALYMTMIPPQPWPSRTSNSEVITALTQYNDGFFDGIERPIKASAPQGVLDWFDRAIAFLERTQDNGKDSIATSN